VTVFITDMNYEPIAPYHFDLSGKAFGALAKPGLNDKLRHCGIMDLEFRRSLSFIDIARSIFLPGSVRANQKWQCVN